MCVGARVSAGVSICPEYQLPLYTSDCSAPRSRVMKEKMGIRKSEVSSRALLPASPSEGENDPPASTVLLYPVKFCKSQLYHSYAKCLEVIFVVIETELN